MPYRMFGFGQPQGESTDDRGRKSDPIFGYSCQSDARPMSAEMAADLISSVSLTGRR